MRQCLSHTPVVCQKTSRQWAESSEAWPLSQWLHLFFSGEAQRSSAPRQLRLCSAPVPQGREGILPGGGLGSWLRTISAGLQPPALPRERARWRKRPARASGRLQTYRAVQSKALPHSVLHLYCPLEHMLLGDKEDMHLFSSVGLWNHLGRIFLIENQNIPWCLTNLQIEKSASACAAGRKEKDLYPEKKKIFFSQNTP